MATELLWIWIMAAGVGGHGGERSGLACGLRLALLRAVRDAGHRPANTADVLLAALAYPPEVVAPQLRAFGIDLTGLIAAVRTALDLGEREDDGGRIRNLPRAASRPRHEDVQIGVRRFIVASPA